MIFKELLEKMDFKAFAKGDLEWHKEEWLKFIEEIIKLERIKLKEKIEGNKRMESDYDDEDKRSRRDVRPFNEALDSVLKLLNDL